MPLDARPGVFRLSSGFFSSIFAADLKYRWRTENPILVSGPRPFRGSRKRSRPLVLFYIKVSSLVSYFVRHSLCQKGTLSFSLAIKKKNQSERRSRLLFLWWLRKNPAFLMSLQRLFQFLSNFSYEVFLFYVHVVHHRIYAASGFKED